jgi:deazaflavin-dependent oxidoreductase (nitroreductase family)
MADTTPNQPDPDHQRGSGNDAEPVGPAPARGGGSSRPARQYRPSRGRRVGDAIMSVFVRAGVVPSTYLLTTRGRRTGRPLTHPVTVVEHDGRRWLVAPYGPVSWVHNARAAGWVSVGRRGDRRAYAIREVPAAEAGPVLKRYVGVATATRPTSRRTRTPRYRTLWPRRTATRCSNSSRSARIALTTTVDVDWDTFYAPHGPMGSMSWMS